MDAVEHLVRIGRLLCAAETEGRTATNTGCIRQDPGNCSQSLADDGNVSGTNKTTLVNELKLTRMVCFREISIISLIIDVLHLLFCFRWCNKQIFDLI